MFWKWFNAVFGRFWRWLEFNEYRPRPQKLWRNDAGATVYFPADYNPNDMLGRWTRVE
jgi:hypothetical protein